MQTRFKTLLASSLLVLTTALGADQTAGSGSQTPIWGNTGPTPITWGDCIPVPIDTSMMPQNGMSMPMMEMGGMNNPIPMPFPLQNGNMAPIFSAPPPSPFFGNNMAAAPMPMVAPIPAPMMIPTPQVPQLTNTCNNDGNQEELHALQNRYNQAAAASKAKIKEITQTMLDAQNQMADARVIIEKLSKQQEVDQTKLSDLEKLKQEYGILSSENKKLKVTFGKMDSAYRFMESKLAKLTSEQDTSSTNTKNVIDALKAKIISLDNSNKTLQAQLNTLQNDAGAQARKLTVLGQSANELTALRSAYKERNDENATLKQKLTKLSSEQTALTLHSAQSDNIIEALKAKVASLDGSNKTLQAKIGTLTSEASSQARKLTVFGQSTNELAALKSAYKSKSADNEALMLKLIEFNNKNKSLQSQISTFKSEAGNQARKLTALSQSSSELTALQSAYKERNNENAMLKNKLSKLESLQTATILKSAQNKNIIDELNKKLASSENQRKTCLANTAKLESTSSSQARQITALMLKSKECSALKSAYDDLNDKKEKLNSELTAATKDTDKDGILDRSDKCPFSLEGAEVNSIGCLADADSDGIADSKDKCPSSPVGSHVNETGCPKIADNDSDGVADANDLCANTAAGTTVNQFGCTPTENITLKGVTFNTGSATLKQSSFPILDAAAETLKKSDINIEIAGYTDFQGSAAINRRLSQRRANTVMIYLIKKGVNARSLSAVGYGEESPVATNQTAEGRATNRRVELKIK